MLATVLGCVCLGIASLIYLSVSNLSVSLPFVFKSPLDLDLAQVPNWNRTR